MKNLKSIFVILFCLSLIALAGCSKPIPKGDTIATINGKAISKSEYMLYLYEATKDFNAIGGDDIWETDFDGQSAEDVVKERAFVTMLHVKVTSDKASKYQVSLSDEEKASAKIDGDAELASMTEEQKNIISISDQDMYKIMEDTLLYKKVIEAVTKDYQPSETEFHAYFEQNKESQRAAYTEYTISNIFVSDQQTAQQISQRLKEGEDFQTLLQEYPSDTQQNQNSGVMETYKNRLDSAFDMDFNLEQGQISEPISTAEGYFIIRVDKKSIPDDAQLKEIMRAEYTTAMKQKVFTDELNQWISDIEIERHEAVWNNVEMIP